MIKLFPIQDKIRAEVSADYPFEVPLKFEVTDLITKETLWQSDLYADHWSEYLYPNTTNPLARIISKNGTVLLEYEWDPTRDGDVINKTFNIWAKLNPGAKGIAIGTNDGTSGEWVYPVRNGLLEAYLVEASLPQYTKLIKNYKNYNNAHSMMALVTKDGGECEFFEGNDGYTNSVIGEITNKYSTNVKKVRFNSISMNDLIISLGLQQDLSWLHLDVEGIDDQLIMSIDESLIKLPQVIIFESINLSEESFMMCKTWLETRGYICIGPIGFNMIATKFKLENV